MDNFYDINDFIVFAFRKWKTILCVVILAAVVFAGNRAVSLYGDYRAQAESVQADAADETEGEERLQHRTLLQKAVLKSRCG